jgi:CheY-like chemotaxis protein
VTFAPLTTGSFKRTLAVPTKAKFLVVDGCRVRVDLITEGLSPWASEIRKAYDGAEAVIVAKEFHPDCVVM